MTINELLNRLDRVKKVGGSKWAALCPAHNDSEPSLSIAERDGKILLHCFAGCTVEKICTALGIKKSDLFYNNGQKQQRKQIVAKYNYVDEGGKLLYQVVRFHPKDFRQRRPGKRGGWIWNTRGVTKVLYNLPEVLKASEVWLAEGEKDVGNLCELGLVATTVPGGAGKIGSCFKNNPGFFSPLQGKTVYIIPDNDEPGKKHAQQLATVLSSNLVKEIRIVELPGLPPKGDVSDFIEQHDDAKERLLALAKEAKPYTPKASWGDVFKSEREEKPTQSEVLLRLCKDIDLFHTPNQESYARLEIEGHFEVWPIRSKGFKRWVSREFYLDQRKAPNSQALNDALNVLEGRALFEGEEHQVYVRVAEHDGKVYLDLCNDEWQVVEVSPDGWQVLNESPVHFKRVKGMQKLPRPSKDGDVAPLRELLNLEDEDDFKLIVAWLVQSLNPSPPYPVLVLYGEQGSSKSTVSRFLRTLIDPSSIALRTTPRNEHDLVIAANNSWALTFDNLSGLPGWLSDAFCRLSTGGGMSTRQLYSDDEEILFSATRPLIINGISGIVFRHDLADRAIFITLPPIPEQKRMPESKLFFRFQEAVPALLGGLLNAVSMALRNINNIRLESLPRMADFALWVTAAEAALPWEPGAFIKVYSQNRKDIISKSVETDLVANELTKWFEGKDSWQGTPTELLEELEKTAAERVMKQKGWPKTAIWLTRKLKRAASFLRQIGIAVEFPRTKENRLVQIERVQKIPSLASLPSPSNNSTDLSGDGKVTVKDNNKFTVTNTVTRKHRVGAGGVSNDSNDTKKHVLSKLTKKKKIKPIFNEQDEADEEAHKKFSLEL